MGKWGFGKRNENGKRLVEECAANGWSIANTFFGLPKKKKWTFYGTFHGRKLREYDHFICDRLTRKRIVKIQNVRNCLLLMSMSPAYAKRLVKNCIPYLV